MRSDHQRVIEREERAMRSQPPSQEAVTERRFSATEELFVPVAGVHPSDLRDTFGHFRSGGRHHEGIDIFSPRGTAVIAAASGKVQLLAFRPQPGRCVWVEGDDGRSYFYAHLDRWTPGIFEGMHVAAGEVLGYVGNTGNASDSSPHLHFEIREADMPLNPYPLLQQFSRPPIPSPLTSTR